MGEQSWTESTTMADYVVLREDFNRMVCEEEELVTDLKERSRGLMVWSWVEKASRRCFKDQKRAQLKRGECTASSRFAREARRIVSWVSVSQKLWSVSTATGHTLCGLLRVQIFRERSRSLKTSKLALSHPLDGIVDGTALSHWFDSGSTRSEMPHMKENFVLTWNLRSKQTQACSMTVSC